MNIAIGFHHHMPLYDYKCHRCGKVFEVRQRFADEPLTVHEECGGDLERLISVPAIQFKGTGWYVTDYGKGGSTPASNGKSESSSSETKTTTTETKTESKPAPATTPDK